MKDFLKILSLILLLSVTACKQNAADKISDEAAQMAKDKVKQSQEGSPEISFESTEFNFGKANEGDIINATFKFTNTGNADLVILGASASCGCTVPDYSKDKLIKPGQSDVIKATFNTRGKPNMQNKTVTLITNTKEQRHLVHIKGFVNPKQS